VVKSDTITGMRPEEIQAHSKEVVSYHINLLIQEELIEGNRSEAIGPSYSFANNLTFKGHDFLDKIRSDTGWNKVKSILKSKGMELSFDAVLNIAKIAVIESTLNSN